ncbi:hypothetical protein [Ekhidna sp.]
MKNYEGLGTPVDIEVKTTTEDIRKKEDGVLVAALDLLRRN